MEKLDLNSVRDVEEALGIYFSDWQLDYLLNKPRTLDMRITGRATGKTTVFIIKQLFESNEVLDLREITKTYNYTEFYKAYVYDIYNKLKYAGIITRKVMF